ncbi:MAG: sigma-70 family RNA polymerase sigma factor [Gemmatimonadetes bacterium]|jgi:RNA polymerase sigma-70 factor, ECF subfamily|nr:sigma-70 family RNA polymerase sigma factor [Gemmatimonadota bacterium]
MAYSDNDLVKQYQQGEPSAFEVLVSRYQRPLFTFLLRLTGSRERAEDLFQETFIKVLEGLPRYRERGKFGSWLFKIAYRLSVDVWRQDGFWRDRVTRTEQLDDIAISTERLPDAVVERAELLQQIEAVVAKLPQKQRRVFLLRQHGGISFREIAELTDEPLNTVLSHMNYAVAKLKMAVESTSAPKESEYGKTRSK